MSVYVSVYKCISEQVCVYMCIIIQVSHYASVSYIHCYLYVTNNLDWFLSFYSFFSLAFLKKKILMDVWQFIIISKQCHFRKVNQTVANNEE